MDTRTVVPIARVATNARRAPLADGPRRFGTGVAVGVLVFLALGGLSYSVARDPGPSQSRQPSAPALTSAPASRPAPSADQSQDLLRLAGSSTMAAQLAPALAEAYLASIGATGVQVATGAFGELRVEGARNGALERITIAGRGSHAAFEGLAAGAIDIGLSSRRVRPEEVQQLAPLGTMTSPANEHVVALDGIAVIASRANPVGELSREQLAGILDGTIADWSGVGGQPGPIHVYAREDGSGTQAMVQMLVLGKGSLAGGATRLPTSQAVLDAVVGDPAGIGVVALPWARAAKVLAVGEGDGGPMIPNPFTLATEEYFLARRLFLYTPQASKNPHVSRFVEFALGPEGQAIVRRVGFVELTMRAEPRTAPEGAPVEYARLTSGSRRLSTNFHFQAASSDLDNRALRDLDRVVDFLRDRDLNGASVRLLGFADNRGSTSINVALSRDRAVRVAQALARRGVTGASIAAMGAAMPIAGNATEEARERNRRVEIWIAR